MHASTLIGSGASLFSVADALKIMPPKRRAVAPPVAVRPTAVGPADHELPAERDDDVPAVVLFHAGKVAKLSEASAGGGSLSRDEAEDAHGEDDGEIDTSVLTEAQQRECVERLAQMLMFTCQERLEHRQAREAIRAEKIKIAHQHLLASVMPSCGAPSTLSRGLSQPTLTVHEQRTAIAAAKAAVRRRLSSSSGGSGGGGENGKGGKDGADSSGAFHAETSEHAHAPADAPTTAAIGEGAPAIADQRGRRPAAASASAGSGDTGEAAAHAEAAGPSAAWAIPSYGAAVGPAPSAPDAAGPAPMVSVTGSNAASYGRMTAGGGYYHAQAAAAAAAAVVSHGSPGVRAPPAPVDGRAAVPVSVLPSSAPPLPHVVALHASAHHDADPSLSHVVAAAHGCVALVNGMHAHQQPSMTPYLPGMPHPAYVGVGSGGMPTATMALPPHSQHSALDALCAAAAAGNYSHDHMNEAAARYYTPWDRERQRQRGLEANDLGASVDPNSGGMMGLAAVAAARMSARQPTAAAAPLAPTPQLSAMPSTHPLIGAAALAALSNSSTSGEHDSLAMYSAVHYAGELPPPSYRPAASEYAAASYAASGLRSSYGGAVLYGDPSAPLHACAGPHMTPALAPCGTYAAAGYPAAAAHLLELNGRGGMSTPTPHLAQALPPHPHLRPVQMVHQPLSGYTIYDTMQPLPPPPPPPPPRRHRRRRRRSQNRSPLRALPGTRPKGQCDTWPCAITSSASSGARAASTYAGGHSSQHAQKRQRRRAAAPRLPRRASCPKSTRPLSGCPRAWHRRRAVCC